MTVADRFDLERFVTAQAPVFETVLAELRAGRKRTHWMWFVFPQLAGLGRSSTARFYGISSIDEARAYLAHPGLGPRLDLCTGIHPCHDFAPVARALGGDLGGSRLIGFGCLGIASTFGLSARRLADLALRS
jgi:hypothetical protein